MQVVQDGEEQEPVHENANQFMTSDVFNVRIDITKHRITHEGQDRPAYPRPEESMLGIDDEADRPYGENTQRKPFNRNKILRADQAGGQRRINQHQQGQPQNNPLAPSVEYLAIQQSGEHRIHSRRAGRKISGYSLHNRQLKYSRGSVMWPVSALAATVSGEARKTCDSLCPMRPGKLRFVALMHFKGVFIRPKVSTGPPRQAAHPAFSVICTPASRRICQIVLAPQRADWRS